MVGVPEFESGTSSLSGTRSNQLSYTPFVRFANSGQAHVLACHEESLKGRRMVEATGIEPVTYSLQSYRSPS